MFKPKKKTNAAVKARIRSVADADAEVDADEAASAQTAGAPKKVPAAAVSVSFGDGDGDGDGGDTDADTRALLDAKNRRKKLKQARLAAGVARAAAADPPPPPLQQQQQHADNPYSAENLRRLAREQKALPRVFSDADADADAPMDVDADAGAAAAAIATRILDPAEIHALRKLKDEKRSRRNAAAQEGDAVDESNSNDFVSLDGKSKKYESRLVTEDQAEDEPEAFEAHEGTRIMFGNKTAEQLKLDRKKAIQNHLMDMDQDDDEEEDPEVDQWQEDQIRKASNGINPTKKKSRSHYNDAELDAIRGYSEAAMPSSTPLVPPTDILKSLTVSLLNLDLEIKNNTHTLSSTESHRESAQTHIRTLQTDIQSASKRYTYYQELVGKWSSFADLLDAKIPLFESLVEDLVAIGMERRKEKDILRIEEVDVRVQGAGNPGAVVVDAFGREVKSGIGGAAGRLISNAEDVELMVKSETLISSVTMREFAERTASIVEKRDLLLSDVAEEYKDIRHVLTLFANWKSEYKSDYVRSYAGLTVHQAVFPFVKMQLVDWDPFAPNAQDLENTSWHNLLTETTDFDEIEGNDEPSDPLIFLVVKKAVFPHVKKLIPTVDLFSLDSVNRVVKLFFTLEQYSSRKSAAFKGLLDALLAHVDQTVTGLLKTFPADLTQVKTEAPSISSDGREAVFWHVFKIFQTLFTFRTILPRDALQQILIETMLTQYLLVFLNGGMAQSLDILKYEMVSFFLSEFVFQVWNAINNFPFVFLFLSQLVAAIPKEWIKSAPKLLAVLERQIKWFAVAIVDKNTERAVLDRVSVLLM
ncbi:hypothetical protein BDR26DRAFT_321880 [Obelidium mucronatum]|nr:hypothetical protein BDR26DRAFT_321880 [Obelidium mucronatum]